MTNSCYFFRKIRDMRPNNDARFDLKRRMIVLTGIRCTYFEFKKGRIKHSAWLYMLRFIATFLTNWYITPWQHNTSINRNTLWNSYLVCAIRHCSPACLVHNFRCQWYTVIIASKTFLNGCDVNWSIRQWRHWTSIWESEKRPYILLN